MADKMNNNILSFLVIEYAMSENKFLATMEMV